MDVKNFTQHAMYTPIFLQGLTNYTPTMILELRFSSSNDQYVFICIRRFDVSLEHVYTPIKPARMPLTAFGLGAQIVQMKIISWGSESGSRHPRT